MYFLKITKNTDFLANEINDGESEIRINDTIRTTYVFWSEDLFIFDLFQKKIQTFTFMEFGAWDGIYLSNCKLFADNGWNGFFIEVIKKDINHCYQITKIIKILVVLENLYVQITI